MRNAIPFISAHAAELRQRLRHEQDGHKKPRLQMLYGLASGQAHTRQEVAPRLGVHRHTIGRWLALYAAGGLHALLATDVPAGQPVSLAPAVLASLEQALRRPEGLASYAALRQWRRQAHAVEVKSKTLSALGRRRFRAKPTVPRPRHTTKACGDACVPSDLSRAAAARHPTHQHPTRAGMQPG
jgi:transposase